MGGVCRLAVVLEGLLRDAYNPLWSMRTFAYQHSMRRSFHFHGQIIVEFHHMRLRELVLRQSRMTAEAIVPPLTVVTVWIVVMGHGEGAGWIDSYKIPLPGHFHLHSQRRKLDRRGQGKRTKR